MKPIKVLFVCMGNICRSPTAHGVFQQIVNEANLSDKFIIESAGTTGYHVGESPDQRACVTAIDKGVDISSIKARKVQTNDFINQNYILAMDYANLHNLTADCPTEHLDKVELLLNYHSNKELEQVPDPYYGGNNGFENVFEMINLACRQLLCDIRVEHNL
ncbi:MAG: protein-tyrosine phosphatase [Enterobacterales bacterium]|jgi:protein-tyrosine phosphatase